MKNANSAPSCSPGDYVVAKLRTQESFFLTFGKVDEVTKDLVVGTIEKDRHIKQLRKGFEVIPSDVVLNLGPKPYAGQILKFDTGHLYTQRKINHEFFGPLYFFYVPSKEVGTTLIKAFDKAASVLRKAKLPEPQNTVWEINSKDQKPAKYAGFYRHSKNPAKKPSTLAIKPEAVPTTVTDYLYIILHEYAHYLHFNHIRNPKTNARWIKLFNTSIRPQTIDRLRVKTLLLKLLEGEDRPSDFRGQLEEQERNAWNWIIRTIGQDHAVSIRELDTLFEAEDKDEITSLWPRRSLLKKELSPVISEYSTRNWRETFAEAFSFHFLGKKLPPAVTSLLEKTLRNIEDIEEPKQTEDEE